MKVTSFYVNSEGERVQRDRASIRRFRCACGEHGWDVAISDDEGVVTNRLIRAYANHAHTKKTAEPVEGVL